jgi:D-alanyl-D-alanine-carboxypeptidase/D-alanyl-D-alanine-endopeptidase
MSTPGPAPSYPPPQFTDPERVDRLTRAFPELDVVFERFAERHRIPGLAFGVVVDDGLAYASGTGTANLATGMTPGPGTVFRIASMTKSFTASCVLMLRDDGLLGLEDPVGHHVPELRSLRYPTADSPPVTIRSLLSMASGLVEDDPWGDRHLDMDAPTFSALLAGGLGFDHVPATAYEYSNLGYAILGRLVANVSGVPLRELCRQRLLQPLGMAATTWDADLVPAEVAAVGYRSEGGSWVAEAVLSDGAFGAMGGLSTTVGDLGRYVAWHLSAWPARDDPDDGPLRRASRREMTQVQRAGPTYLSLGQDPDAPFTQDGYGYGLVTGVHPRQGRVVGHSGGLPGFASHMEWLPDAGVGVVVLTNRTYIPAKSVVRKAFDVLESTGGLEERALPPSPMLVAARDAIAGLYERWDPSAAAAAMLDTYFLDLDDGHRAPDFAQLHAAHGAIVALGPVTPTGALRGQWRMTCDRGALDVEVMLGPMLPTRIQFVTVTPIDGTEPGDQ